MERKQIVIRLNPDIYKEFKVLAALNDTNMQEIVDKLIKEWIERVK